MTWRNYARDGYDPDDGLAEGRWVTNGRGTLVWQDDPTPLIDQARVDVALLIACPTCHAKVTEICRTRSGRRTTPHDSRLAPRLCCCGTLLAPRARYCEPCRDEANRASKRESQRRIRAARREVA